MYLKPRALRPDETGLVRFWSPIGTSATGKIGNRVSGALPKAVDAPSTRRPLLHRHEDRLRQVDGAAAVFAHRFHQVEPILEVEVDGTVGAEVLQA